MGVADKVVDKASSLFSDFVNIAKKKIFSFWNHIRKSDAWQLAGMLLAVGFFSFVTIYVTNMFTIPLGGDFVLQMLPFQYSTYDAWHLFFKTGTFPVWNNQGTLGIPLIAGDSFYYMFDPWMLISLVFPRGWLSSVQGIMTIVKMMTAGMIFYYYLSSLKLSVTTRKIGAVCFAFSGWIFFNLWFHFIEVYPFFPLVLWGIEKVIKERKPQVLIAGLVLVGVANYFFFVVTCVGAVMYALFRLCQEAKNNKFKDNMKVLGIGVACFAIAILSISAVFLPSLLNTMNNPRVDDGYLQRIIQAKGFVDKLRIIFTWEGAGQPEYKHLFPLDTFLFMNLGCFRNALLPDRYFDNINCSVFIMSPMILMLTPSILDSIKQRKWSHIIGFVIVTVMLFTPFSYYLFFGFTAGYGRWYYFPMMWMLVFFLIHFDRHKKMPGWYFDASIVVTGILYTVCIYFCYQMVDKYNNLMAIEGDRFLLIPLQMVWVLICYLIMRIMHRKKGFKTAILYMVCFEAIILGNVTVRVQGSGSGFYQSLSGGLNNINEERKIVLALQKYDDSDFKMFNTTADRGSVNVQARLGYNGVSSFHSVYAYEATDFLNWSKLAYTNGSWSMGNHEKRYNLDTFMGVKYYLTKKPSVDTNNRYGYPLDGIYTHNIPYGYTNILDTEDCPTNLREILENGSHELYVNNNYINTIFAYDEITTVDDGILNSRNSVDSNEAKYLKYGIVYQDDLADIQNESDEITYVESPRTSIYSVSTGNYTVYRTRYDENGHLIGSTTPGKFGIYEGDLESNYSSDAARELPIRSKVVLEAYDNNLVCPDASEHGGCFASVQYLFGYNVDFAFYDQNDEKITNDIHMWNTYSKTSDQKMSRGFYLDRPAKTIVATWFENIVSNYVFPRFSINYQYNDVYQGNIDKLKSSESEITYQDLEKGLMNFNTNYSKDKYVVLNIVDNNGWKLTRKAKDSDTYEEVKTYKGQGGFISFVAPSGEYEYKLVYETPGLALGKSFTLLGIISQAFVIAYYYSLNLHKMYGLVKLSSLKTMKGKKFKKTEKL